MFWLSAFIGPKFVFWINCQVSWRAQSWNSSVKLYCKYQCNSVLMENTETVSTVILCHPHAQRPFQSPFRSENECSWNCTLTISYLLGTLACQTWWLQNGWRAPVRTSSYWFSVSSKQRKSHVHTVSSSAVKYRHQWSFTGAGVGRQTASFCQYLHLF